MTDTIVFTRGVPPTEAFPTDELAQCFDAALRNDTAVVLQYGQQPGYPALRRLLAAEYGVADNEVLIGNGSLQLQDLVSAYLIRPGATVLTEQPSYDRAIGTFRRRGAKTIGIPLEPDGIDVARLEAEVRHQVPAFLYLVPDFQNPAGATLSLAKRQAVVALAQRYGFWVIEDVPYRKLRYQGEDLPLLRSIDASRVITMSSFSKLLSPGIRVGSVDRAGRADCGGDQGRRGHLSVAGAAHPGGRGRGPRARLAAPEYRAAQSAVPAALAGDGECDAPAAGRRKIFAPDGGFFVSVLLPEDELRRAGGTGQRPRAGADARPGLLRRNTRPGHDPGRRALCAPPVLRRRTRADRRGRAPAGQPAVAA